MAIAIEDCGFKIRDMLVWKREGQAKAFSQDHFVRKMNIPEEEKEKKIPISLDGRKNPFLGSGSTGIACYNTGRKLIGIELDRNYYEEAKKE